MKTKKRIRIAVMLCLLAMLVAIMAACGSTGSNGENEPEDEAVAVQSEDSSESSLQAVPGLEKFMGGWGTLDCRTSEDSDEVSIVELTDEDGKLEVNLATITGGGYKAIFSEGDISCDGDTMKCVNGHVIMDGGELNDGILTVSPSPSKEGGYSFVLSNEGGEIREDRSNSYVYTKVGTTSDELQEWINKNHEPI